MASVRWKQMHTTTLMHLFTKNTFRWKKSAELLINPNNQKNLEKKKQKTSRKPKKPKKTKKTKKHKKPRVSGKGFGGHFSQIPWFFCFFWFLCFFVFFGFFVFLVFLSSFFCVFWFFEFSDDFPEAFFRFASIWIVHSRCCADCTFSTELCARCPTACLSFFFQSKQLFYIPTTWQKFA